VAALPALAMADPEAGYSSAEAAAEAARCLQCQCLECVKACPFLEHYKAYPKIYARQIYNNAAIVKGQHTANVLINSCMLCGLCTELCPEDFPMAATCLDARRDLVAKGKMPPSAHEFALMDMEFAQSEACFLARGAPLSPGEGKCRRLFFPGCQLSATKPEAVTAAYAALREIFPGEAGIMLSCCGAPARWAGREDLFDASMARLRSFWEDSGRPEIIAACPACLNMVEAGLPGAKATSLWEVLDHSDLSFPKRSSEAALAVHDPCTVRERTQVRESARRLLSRLGASCEELRFSGKRTKCCGFGGLLSEADPDLAATVGSRRAAESRADFVTYCAMCRDRLAKSGKRVLHLADLLFPGPDLDPAALPPVGVSRRRENRARLKRTVLREIFGQSPPEPGAGLILHLAPEVAAVLEKRRILEDDVRAVIAHAESSGKKFRHRQTGRFLACHGPANATFWVEYSPADDGFAVHNAYAHRMALKEGRS
jgi:Fe-S oxidoreductase